jgi:hypothetical protein
MRRNLLLSLAAVAALLAPAAGVHAAGVAVGPLVARIKAIGREGAGNAEAARAWRALAHLGPEALPDLLAALDDADPTAANWLGAAVDAVAERTLNAGKPLPAAALEAFVKDTRHAATARRLAYEWLCRADPGTPDRLVPGMLHDPGAELRRDAVARALKEADALFARGDKGAATAAFRKALSGACDRDQVERAAQALKGLGVEVDLARHFGFVRRWMLIAPFDNTAEAGYARAYPPEEVVDLATTYKGKGGAEARWRPEATKDPYGIVDLNQPLGRQKGVVAYAFAEIVSPEERPVQVRVGCINAVKVFLNGKPIFGREEYHHGIYLDQYVASGTLKAGRNELLLKICQNEQSEVWAQEWRFQARLCDAAGAAVPFTVVNEPEAKKGRREAQR